MVLGGIPEKAKDDNTRRCLPLSSRMRRRLFRLLFPLSLAKVLLSVFFQFFNLFLQGVQLSVHLRQPLEDGLRLEVGTLFHRRCADELLVAFQAARQALKSRALLLGRGSYGFFCGKQPRADRYGRAAG